MRIFPCLLSLPLCGCGPTKQDLEQRAAEARYTARAFADQEARLNYRRWELHTMHTDLGDLAFRIDTRTGRVWRLGPVGLAFSEITPGDRTNFFPGGRWLDADEVPTP